MSNFADWCAQLLAGRIFDRAPRPVPCTMHDVVEGGWGGQPRVYPYRCHRCGCCLLCQHRLIRYSAWVCFDGEQVPTTPGPGSPVL